MPKVNLLKFFIVINLWVLLFTQFFVLIPVSVYAATPKVAVQTSESAKSPNSLTIPKVIPEKTTDKVTDATNAPSADLEKAKQDSIIIPKDSTETKTSYITKDGKNSIEEYSLVPTNNIQGNKISKIDDSTKFIGSVQEDTVEEQTIDKNGKVVETVNLDQTEVSASSFLQKAVSNSKLLSGENKKVQKKSKVDVKTFKAENNIFKLEFRNGVNVKIGDNNVTLKPVTNRKLNPEKYLDGVIYRNVWKGVDVYYELEGTAVKEFIYIRSIGANISEIKFEILGGDFVSENSKSYIEVGSKKLEILPYTISTANFGFVENAKDKIISTFTKNIQTIKFESKWYSSLTTDSFPLTIDPSFIEGITNGDAADATFRAVNSRNYICEPRECDLYVGAKLFNSNSSWTWRSEIYIPYHYNEIRNSKLERASLYIEWDQRYASQPNIDNNYPIYVAWANCFGFNCVSQSPVSSANITRAGSIDITNTVRWMLDNKVDGGWFMLWSNEGVNNSYKVFQPSRTRLSIDYSLASPNIPTNTDQDPHDIVGGCVANTSGNCSIGANVAIPTKNWYDGKQDCNSGNIDAHNLSLSLLEAYPGLIGWRREITNLSDKGAACKDWTTIFNNWKMNGTYLQKFAARNKASQIYSGEGNYTKFTIDNSIPVRIDPNPNNIPNVTNGNIAVTAPEFVDDASSFVYIYTPTGGSLDASGGVFAQSGNSLDFSRVYNSQAKWNVPQTWVMEGNGLIKNLENGKCLGIWEPSGIVYATMNCSDASFLKWKYNPETGELVNSYWGWCLEVNGADVWHRQCNGSANQKFNIDKYRPTDWVSDYQKVEYKFVVADAVDGHWYDQYTRDFNDSRNANWSLEDGKRYNFWVQTRDRTSGHAANYSDWYLLGTSTIDRKSPEVTNLTINNGKTFSPGNLSGGKNNITFTYDYKDANPFAALLYVWQSTGNGNWNRVRKLGYNDSIVPANLPALQPGNIRQYFTWDGKDDSGNPTSEGIYVVSPLAIDSTCIPYASVNYEIVNCNATREFQTGTDRIFTLDNTGANVKVAQPRYNIWTNNPSYVLDGQVATLHVDGKSDQDIAKFIINANDIPLTPDANGAKRYQYKTTLSLGQNVFTMATIDQADNVVSDIGDPAGTLQKNWIVNYENISPKLTNILETKSTIPQKTSLRVEFNDAGTVSSGINLDSLKINLLRSTDNKVYSKMGSLVTLGKSNNSTYLESFNCTQNFCNVNLQNLSDGYYKLFVTFEDNATNNTCSENEFVEIPTVCNTISDFEKVIVMGNVAGNLAPNPSVDNTRGLLSVDLVPSLEGVNDATVLAKLASGELNIDQVQGLTVKLRVSQGVEAVDLSYSYDTNQDPRKIATISGLQDTRTQYNNRSQNVGNATTGYQNITDKTKFKKCELAECTWVYTIVYDRTFGGGTFRLVIDSFKPRANVGTLVESARKDFVVNGIIQTTPKILRVDNSTKVTNFYSGVYFTNLQSNKVWFAGAPDVNYTFYIGNSSYSAKANQIGLGSFDVNLAGDDNYPVMFKGTTLSYITLDRVAPSVVGVTTTNISNPNSIIPFIRSGDQIRWNVELSESVALSSVILENGYRAYGDKATNLTQCNVYNDVQLLLESGTAECNSAWRNSKIQVMEGNVSSAEKIYYPIIYAEDFAGNQALAQSASGGVSYTTTPRGKSTDYRLFIDSTIPEKQEIDTSTWNDGKDGVNADGLTPEVDRLGSGKFVIRGNTVTLKTKGERNARGVFTSGGNNFVVNPTNANCTAGTNITTNNVITKYGELCDLTYTYTFPSNYGTQKENGEALSSSSFGFYQMDLAGNMSLTSSNSVVVYNDKVAPSIQIQTFETNDGNTVLGDVNSNDSKLRAITKSNQVKLETIGEQKSDVETEILKNGISKTKRLQKAGEQTSTTGVVTSIADKSNTRANANFQLSTNTTDERAGCTQLISGRNTGICDDGVYIFNSTDTDTSGNRSGIKTIYVERDTVRPISPTVTLVQSGGILNPQVKTTVVGEVNTQAKVIIYGKEKSLFLETGTRDFDTSLSCGVVTTIQVSLIDRAGNESVATTKTIPAVACASCGVGTLLTPIPNTPITTSYGYSSGYFNSQAFHTGLDYSAPAGTPVYATESGIVKEIVITQDDDYPKTFDGVKCTNCKYGTSANRIVIDHGNGLTTSYYHLKYNSSNLKVGNTVMKGIQIGQVGTTGLSTGSHLHFQVEVNDKHQNPLTYLSGKGSSNYSGNLTDNEKTQFGCVPVRQSNEKDVSDNPPPIITTPPATGGSDDYSDIGEIDLSSAENKCLKFSINAKLGIVSPEMTENEKEDCFGASSESYQETNLTIAQIREILKKGNNFILNKVWENTTDDQLACLLDSDAAPATDGWKQNVLIGTDTAISFIPIIGDLYGLGTSAAGYSISGKMTCVDRWLAKTFSEIGLTATIVSAALTVEAVGAGGVVASEVEALAKNAMKETAQLGAKEFVKNIVKSSAKFIVSTLVSVLALKLTAAGIGYVIENSGILSVDYTKLQNVTPEEVEIMKAGEKAVKNLATTATIVVAGVVVRTVRAQMWVSKLGITIRTAALKVSSLSVHLQPFANFVGDAVTTKQAKSVVENYPKLTELSNIQKGNFGEMVADINLTQKGYKNISVSQVQDVMEGGHTGIDGVFEKNGQYFVVEGKFNKSTLGKLTDGTPQMSDDWILGKEGTPIKDSRLSKALGGNFSLAQRIKDIGFTRILVKISPTGKVDLTKLDSSAKSISIFQP